MTALRVLATATLLSAGVFPFGLCALVVDGHRRGVRRLRRAGAR